MRIDEFIRQLEQSDLLNIDSNRPDHSDEVVQFGHGTIKVYLKKRPRKIYTRYDDLNEVRAAHPDLDVLNRADSIKEFAADSGVCLEDIEVWLTKTMLEITFSYTRRSAF